jgi:hypothetical protein
MAAEKRSDHLIGRSDRSQEKHGFQKAQIVSHVFIANVFLCFIYNGIELRWYSVARILSQHIRN